jgi:ActR/RegA family two-component response regulator/two-component sensor histidine kinase
MILIALCISLVFIFLYKRDLRILALQIETEQRDSDFLFSSQAKKIISSLSQKKRLDSLREDTGKSNISEKISNQQIPTFHESSTSFFPLQDHDSIAHDLKAPLLSALSYMHSMEIGTSYKELFQPLRANLESSLLMIDGTIDSLNMNRGRMEALRENLKLAPTIKSVIERFMPLAEEKKKQIHYSENDLSGLIDRTHFTRILENLLSNALKYSTGAHITIHTQQDTPHSIIVDMIDQGPMIPEDVLEFIFERTITSSTSYSSGIGLSLVKNLLELNRGLLEYGEQNSEKYFRVRLEAGFPEKKKDITTDSLLNYSIEKILILEDDAPTSRALARSIQSLAKEIIPTSSIAQASFHLSFHKPELLISDLTLFGQDSEAFLNGVLEENAVIRILIVSGKRREAISKDLLDHPRVRFLQKPWAKDILIEKIGEVTGARLSPLDRRV